MDNPRFVDDLYCHAPGKVLLRQVLGRLVAADVDGYDDGDYQDA